MAPSTSTRLAAAVTLFATACALNNGLGRTPQMGYNSWYDVEMSPSDAHVRAVAQRMVSLGLVDLGYTYLNLDDGIVEVNRDANGDLVPDKKGFPNGFATLAADLLAMGLKFGVYTDRGTNTCGGRAGAFGHEAQDAAFYARNGILYVKEDSCNASGDHQTAFAEYARMRDGLNATGVPIFFSLCSWEAWYAPVGHALGNSWRTGPDDINWHGVLTNVDILSSLYMYGGPGGWNDPCLLLGRDHSGAEAVTDQQGRAQFSFWAIVAAPLLLSQDIFNWTSMQIETYTNREVIAVSQDVLGRPGQRLLGGPLSPGGDGNTPLTVAACVPGASDQTWTFNVTGPLFIVSKANGQCINSDDCGAPLITYPCVPPPGPTCSGANVQNEQFVFAPDGTMRSAMGGAPQCVTSQGVGAQAQLAPCSPTPAAAGQAWAPGAGGAIVDGAGRCLSAGGGGPAGAQANVWGRPLASGAWAVMFVNAGAAAVDLACDAACLAPTGWEPEQVLAVRDLWAHADLGNTTAGAGLNVTALAGDGGVEMYTLTPLFG